MKIAQLALIVPFLALGSLAGAQSQTLPAGYDNVQGGSGTAFPFNQTSDHKWQWHYDSSNFAQTGPITITEISIRALSPTVTINAFNFPSLTVTVSEATTDYTVAGHDPIFANNLGANTLVVRSGPWAGGPVGPSGGATSTWIPFGLTTPFVYDPTLGNDLIIQLEKCGTTSTFGQSIDGRSAGAGLNKGNRYGDTSSCSATSHSFSNNEYVPIVKLDYVLGGSGPTVYCTAKVNSLGCTPTIGFAGTPSATAGAGFTVDGTNVRNNKSGLLFYGMTGQNSTPFQGGTLCVATPIKRTPAVFSNGTPVPVNDCTGVYSIDMNAFAVGSLGGNPAPVLLVPGTVVDCQYWGRDPGFPPPANTTLTDGLEYTVGP